MKPIISTNHPRPVSKRAFTLVELLVVISIVALLIALLLPALGRSRSVARTAMCLSNIRSMGYSMYSYATMYKDAVVPSLQSNGINVFWWVALSRANEIDLPKITVWTAPPTTGATVFKCPETILDYAWNDTVHTYNMVGWDDDSTFRMMRCRYNDGSNVYFWDSSYAAMSYNGDWDANLLWNSVPCHQIPNGNVTAKSPSDPNNLVKVSDLNKPSRLVFLYDGVDRQIMTGLSARHNNKTDTNVLFYDGHASTNKCTTENFPNGFGSTYFGIGAPVAGGTYAAFSLTNLKNKQTMNFRNDQ